MGLDFSERDLAALFDSAQELICVAGADGFLKKVNSSFVRAFGFNESELLRRPYIEFVHPDDRERVVLTAQAALEGQKISNFGMKIVRGDGSVGVLSWNCSRHGDFIFGIGRDVTEEHKISQRRLETQAGEDFRTLADTLPAVVWMSAPDGAVTYLNDYWHQFVGTSPKTGFSETWFEVMHPDDRDRCLQIAAESKRAGSIFECQYRLFSAEQNRYCWYLGRAVPVRDAKGEITKWLGTATLIDDQIRAQQALEQTIVEMRKVSQEKAELLALEKAARESSRLKSEFLANMSHEIRTPLNGIAGMTTLLSGTRLTELQGEYVQTIAKSSEALLAIINDILDLSKIEAGKLELVSQPFDLQDLVDDVEKVLGYSAKSKSLNLRCVVNEDFRDKHVVGDATRVRQVLFNLVQNALKFTARGEVSVKASFDELVGDRAEIRIEVKDTGIGLDPSVHKAIFQPFEQADNTTTRRFGGTGLGLSISKNLVELMGGEIGVRSAAGQGSVFWFVIPMTVCPATKTAVVSQIPERAKRASLTGLRVLVAEDHPTNRRVLERMLASEGCQATLVENGAEAVREALSKTFDLVLMDCHMPEMDGFTAAAKMRSSNIQIPIIALTADVMKGTRERCLEAGMTGYLSKPVNFVELKEMLSRSSPARFPQPAAKIKLKSKSKKSVVFNESSLQRIDQLSIESPDDLFTEELLISFLEETPSKIEKIKEALGRDDKKAAQFEAHGLKSVAALIGAETVRDICADLEAKLTGKTSHHFIQRIHILDQAFAEVCAPIKDVLNQRSQKRA